ncbi:18509_t:CDS:1, partial [Gigaspora rosea]
GAPVFNSALEKFAERYLSRCYSTYLNVYVIINLSNMTYFHIRCKIVEKKLENLSIRETAKYLGVNRSFCGSSSQTIAK